MARREKDRAGRVKVGPDLTIPGRPEIFVIGDTAAVVDAEGKAVPGIAPAAKQMGKYVAEVIASRVEGRTPPGPFRYRHQGDLATIGRKAAVVKLNRFHLKGFIGWLFWGFAHVYFLIGLRNRAAVAFAWLWNYLTYQRGARLIVDSKTSQKETQKDQARPDILAPEAKRDPNAGRKHSAGAN